MKHASFTAAISLFALSLLVWIYPQALLPAVLCIVAAAIPVLLLYLIRKSILFRDILFCLCALLLSTIFLWSPVTDYYRTAEAFHGKTYPLTVTLTEEPTFTSSGKYRYTVRPKEGQFSQKFVFFHESHLANAGDSLTATFAFSKPDDAYFFENCSEGIVLTAYVKTPSENISVFDGEVSFLTLSGTVRRRIETTFLRYIGGSQSGFMTAVLTGDKDSLSARDYSALQDTGMLHIVAVSGLHVSVFVSFVLFFLKKVRHLRIRIILSVLSLGIVLLFSGFTPSVCRAVIMNLIAFGGDWFSEEGDALNRLGIAGIVILLVSPYAGLSLSFQLSFCATLGILLLSKPFTQTVFQWLFVKHHIVCGRVLANLISITVMSLAALTFTVPLLWLRLNSYSIWSLYLSPILLPVLQICFFLALILLILSFFSFMSLACKILGLLIRYGVIFMTSLSTYAASLMDMVESVPNSLKWVVAVALLLFAGILFFLPASKKTSKKKRRQITQKGLSLVIFAVALLTAYQASESVSSNLTVGEVAPSSGVIQTAFLDVGQGNCFVTLLDNEAYVVDCGGTKEPGIVAADYLTSAGIDTVKFVLISHLHDDHANGLEDLCAEKEIEEIIIPYTEGDAALYAKITALAAEEEATLTVLEEDTQRTLGNSTLRMLTKHLDPTSDDQNENSIVGLCEYGNYRALFTGDITAKAERRLVSSYGTALDCDVLSVPHHGSKSSSCDRFLQTCSPVYAVISVGLKNSYGHPTHEAMDRIATAGSTLLRTDELGTVTIRSDGEKMEVVPREP